VELAKINFLLYLIIQMSFYPMYINYTQNLHILQNYYH